MGLHLCGRSASRATTSQSHLVGSWPIAACHISNWPTRGLCVSPQKCNDPKILADCYHGTLVASYSIDERAKTCRPPRRDTAGARQPTRKVSTIVQNNHRDIKLSSSTPHRNAHSCAWGRQFPSRPQSKKTPRLARNESARRKSCGRRCRARRAGRFKIRGLDHLASADRRRIPATVEEDARSEAHGLWRRGLWRCFLRFFHLYVLGAICVFETGQCEGRGSTTSCLRTN